VPHRPCVYHIRSIALVLSPGSETRDSNSEAPGDDRAGVSRQVDVASGNRAKEDGSRRATAAHAKHSASSPASARRNVLLLARRSIPGIAAIFCVPDW